MFFSLCDVVNPLRYRGHVYDQETGLYYLQSRYYDPEIGRFINADAFTSTGQGFVGNNMFAYCGNNPVGYEDEAGKMHKLCTVTNGAGSPASVRSLLYIKKQSDASIGNKNIGIASVSHGGCGAVATYNALVSLGNYTSFDSVLDYYNQKIFELTFFGLAGMLPHTVAGYFENAGYNVLVTDELDGLDVYSQSADACIMFYMFPLTHTLPASLSTTMVGAHFVSYTKTENGYLAYNTGSPSGVSGFAYPSDFAYQGQRFYAVGIFIYE